VPGILKPNAAALARTSTSCIGLPQVAQIGIQSSGRAVLGWDTGHLRMFGKYGVTLLSPAPQIILDIGGGA
jgi:hypothetical protein